MRILQEDDLNAIPTRVFLDAVRAQIDADARGEAISPPRHRVDFDPGALVFTCGGNKDLAGFRVYDTFPKRKNAVEEQLVVVFDRTTAKIKGIAIGERLGAIRTGCLGGVAIDRLVPEERIEKLALIGTGTQAQTQLEAILSLREVGKVSVFSRSMERRGNFATDMAKKLSANITPTSSAERAVRDADVVILATNSSEPVIDTEWIKHGAHVTTLGPKFVDRHELPLDIVARTRLIVSDSPQQIAGQGNKHMFHDQNLPVQHLGAQTFNSAAGDLTLFLSAGLAGTEVTALSAAIDYLDQQSG
ncbi:NAD(P)-binding domain-containing protein [uncultured Maritalea sp.]|jgi:ornithine cyclodeaminase/alanine dehydrogenase-like protein (mu-crystallin family)|uniref:ornithine cyclodeaminase family protein n=1 Tax=uncultured Maritalea sp. TaxID=757249 RepID=UPI002637E22C|nr:NAD(P)-binding domain-containing protein [uncultured Maritalea sp.]